MNIEELSLVSINVDDEKITAEISDGRSVSIPVAWFPRLANADQKQRDHFEISPSGYGVHWPDVDEDEDVSIKTFVLSRP
jgi:hypothetical protein